MGKAMNERMRMQYLDAMGIDTFVPRFTLPNAKLSVQCLLPVVQSQPVSSAPDSVPLMDEPLHSTIANENTVAAHSVAKPLSSIVGSRTGTLKSISDVLSGDSIGAFSELKKPEKNADIVSRTAEKNTKNINDATAQKHRLAQKPEPAHFLLQVWRATNDILVIDSRTKGDALPTATLLINILRAIGNSDGYLPKSEQIQWPMVNVPGMDASWPAAQEMVSHFLEGRFAERPVASLFLFGLDAQRAVLTSHQNDISASKNSAALTESTAIANHNIVLHGINCEAFCLPALSELLLTPLLKKDVWRLLSRRFSQPIPQ